MSLGGIAIAIGAMVDAAVVMIENAHKRLEAWHHAHPGAALAGEDRWGVIGEAAAQVGPALFISLLIITFSFVPVFTLEAQEGRLFSPLAFTKTYAMAAAAGLSVTLIPVLMGYLIRGRIPSEQSNPLNRFLIAIYRPLLNAVLQGPKRTLAVATVLLLLSLWPLQHIGGEFMPRLDEGDLLYMPSALPGLSAGKAGELLQQTDRLIKTVPEVASVYGKAGRAETATDPAPMEMFETTIQFKPREQWRAGMTQDKLVEELDRIVKVPGLSNIWVPPIRNRIDMLATGIKSPVGVKVAGTDLATIDRLAGEIERALKDVPGVTSALAERLTGGRYVDVNIRRDAAARFGLNIADVQSVISSAVGGENIGETVEGLQRFPINMRYPREFRERATAKLKVVVPFTLLIIFVLLYLTFKRFDEALLIMATLPFALVGGIWLLYLLGYNLSVAGAVGFIALAGVSAEFGVIMLLYLKSAWEDRLDRGKTTAADLLDAIREGAVLRVRPKAMTVAVILAGLFPIMWGMGAGSEGMQRIGAPMVGGMITAPLLSLFVIPAAYLLMRRPREQQVAGWRLWRRPHEAA